jgi:hypothetical protein
MNTRLLAWLTGLAFIGFSASAIAAKPTCPDGSCNGNEDQNSCPADCDGGGGGSQEYPKYNVTFTGALVGSGGTKWQSGQNQEGITYFLSDQQGGTGDMDLSYFQNPFPEGPFTGQRGMNCFDQSTPINAVQFYRDKIGMAVFKGSFIGRSDDRETDFMYLFTLKGIFDEPSNWLPQGSTTVIMSSWELKLKQKREDNLYSNITCTGGGSFETSIVVSRN